MVINILLFSSFSLSQTSDFMIIWGGVLVLEESNGQYEINVCSFFFGVDWTSAHFHSEDLHICSPNMMDDQTI